MRNYLILWLFVILVATRGEADGAKRQCTPAYAVLQEEISVPLGNWHLNFRLLAVGCQESLSRAWPPRREVLERELASELSGQHPVKTLLLINEQSSDFRKRVTGKVNKILGSPVVQDVFLFNAKAAEDI